MTLEEYKDITLTKIVNSDTSATYKCITSALPAKGNKNEDTFAIIKQLNNKHVTLCAGSLIRVIEHYYEIAGVYNGGNVSDSAKRVYSKGNLVHRNNIKYERVTIENIEYDLVLEDYGPISMYGAVAVSNHTHGDYRLVYKVNNENYISKYRVRSTKYVGAEVYYNGEKIGTVTKYGIVDYCNRIIDIEQYDIEMLQCGIYNMNDIFLEVA